MPSPSDTLPAQEQVRENQRRETMLPAFVGQTFQVCAWGWYASCPGLGFNRVHTVLILKGKNEGLGVWTTSWGPGCPCTHGNVKPR